MTTEKTKYSLYHKSFKGSVFQIMVVSGQHNYVSVTKKTNNPFGGKIGKDFDSFNEAAKHYKSPEMKTFILQVEMGLLTPDHVQEI